MTKKSSKQTKTGKSPTGKTKFDRVIALLGRPAGASIADMMKSTEWQSHSVRGFLAGALKKKGYTATGELGNDGIRRYYLVAEVAS